jgi:hypothetical protein
MRQVLSDFMRTGSTKLPGVSLSNKQLIGEGSYALVYAAFATGPAIAPGNVALKVTAPASVWEFYIQRTLSRLVPDSTSLFMPALALFVGQDGDSAATTTRKPRLTALQQHSDIRDDNSGRAGILVLPLREHGTLLDLITSHQRTDHQLGSSLLLYLTLQLLQVHPSTIRRRPENEHTLNKGGASLTRKNDFVAIVAYITMWSLQIIPCTLLYIDIYFALFQLNSVFIPVYRSVLLSAACLVLQSATAYLSSHSLHSIESKLQHQLLCCDLVSLMLDADA